MPFIMSYSLSEVGYDTLSEQWHVHSQGIQLFLTCSLYGTESLPVTCTHFSSKLCRANMIGISFDTSWNTLGGK